MAKTTKAKQTADGIRVYCSHDEIIPIAELKPNPENPNTHPAEQIDLLAEIIKGNGWRDRITVSNLSGLIVKGHGRYMAAIQAGLAEAPVDFQDYDNAVDEIADLIADNKISELSRVDNKLAREMMLTLDDFNLGDMPDLGRFGFNNDEIFKIFPEMSQGESEDDEVPEVDEADVKTKPGDLYLLGRHRLLCGDATKEKDVARLMDGNEINVILTDPPYGQRLDTDYSKLPIGSSKSQIKVKGKKYPPIIGDNNNFNAKPIRDMFKDAKEQFWFGADYYFSTLVATDIEGSWLVWDKRNERQDDVIGSGFELCWTSKKHQRRMLRHYWVGAFGSTEARDRKHPSQKPTALLIDIMDRWVRNGFIIIDPFLGSGSTLIACEKTDRICYGMEIDPYYCDVIVKRWEEFTGQTATLEGA